MSYPTPPVTTTPLSDDEFRALAALDTCSIANAIERFDVRLRNEGYTEQGLTCRFPKLPAMLGYACTLQVRSYAPPTKGRVYFENNDWWDFLLTIPAPRILVIQDMDRQPGVGAVIGDVHARILQSLGCVGVVTNGAVRDLPKVEALNFQMFSGSVSVSHGYSHVVHVGGPVQVAGLEVVPGALLHGDCHGVIRIPRNLAGRIPKAAEELQQKEKEIIDYCQSPGFSVEGLRQIVNR